MVVQPNDSQINWKEKRLKVCKCVCVFLSEGLIDWLGVCVCVCVWVCVFMSVWTVLCVLPSVRGVVSCDVTRTVTSRSRTPERRKRYWSHRNRRHVVSCLSWKQRRDAQEKPCSLSYQRLSFKRSFISTVSPQRSRSGCTYGVEMRIRALSAPRLDVSGQKSAPFQVSKHLK